MKQSVGGEEQDRECPNCHSKKIWKDGIRRTLNHVVQRCICRDCGYRFSESPILSIGTSSNCNRRVCATLAEAKNLENAAETKSVAGESHVESEDVKEKILQYAWQLKKKGRSEATIESRVRRLKGLAKACNLTDPESVKGALANAKWKNSTKAITTSVYSNFLNFQGIEWEAPEYKMETSIPFIPLESEIDQLIAGCSKRTATLLQLLRETGVRIGEAARLMWIEFDPERKTIRVQAEKGSNPRICSISEKLVGMLNALPKKNEYIFHRNTSMLRNTFANQRKRVAAKLNNPRLRRITFHTLRHWKGTMEYHKTKDPWHVKRLLGHKTLRSTEIYINIEQAVFPETSEEYHVKVAHNLKEACQLTEAGFQHVTDMDGVKIFRKRK